jgi:hypothetical protein
LFDDYLIILPRSNLIEPFVIKICPIILEPFQLFYVIFPFLHFINAFIQTFFLIITLIEKVHRYTNLGVVVHVWIHHNLLALQRFSLIGGALE